MMRAMIVAVLALAPLAGCVNLERSYPEKTYHALSAEREGARRTGAPRGILRVPPCRVASGYDRTPIIVRKGDRVYEADFYNEFFLPPSEMLTAATREWLARSGLFETVVPGASLVDADLVLETSVPALYADFRGGEPLAVLAFQVLLIRDGPGGARILLERNYREAMPVPDRSAAGAAAGLDAALAKVLTNLEADLAKVDLARPPAAVPPAAPVRNQ